MNIKSLKSTILIPLPIRFLNSLTGLTGLFGTLLDNILSLYRSIVGWYLSGYVYKAVLIFPTCYTA